MLIDVNPFLIPQNTTVPNFMLSPLMEQFQQNLEVNCQTNNFSDSETIQQPCLTFRSGRLRLVLRHKTSSDIRSDLCCSLQ